MWQMIKYALREFYLACWEVIKLPFWMIGQGWKKLLSFGRQRIFIVLAATVIVTVIFMLSFVKVTSQPTFCKSCHVMEPYFVAWETSTHSNVSCTECHIPPGLEGTVHSKFMALSMVANYFTGVYKRSKPWAEIEDQSCLREGCHDTRLLEGVVDFNNVKFDHTPHLESTRRERQLRCTSCHAQIVQGEHITVTGTTCFLCHFKPDTTGRWSDLARCTHCHNPPQGASVVDTSFDHSSVLARGVECISCHATEVSGDGFVPRERCNSCHAKAEHAERYDDHEFVHKMHVTEHKVECTQCHLAIRHGKEAVAEISQAQTCSECHGGSDNAIEAVWSGRLPGLPTSPSSMARAGMSCTSCHVGDIHGKVRATEPTCLPCHEDSYDRLWPRWQQPLMETLTALEAETRKLPTAQGDTLRKALAIYRRGNPMHNPDLVRVLAAKIEGDHPDQQHVSSCNSCHPAAGKSIVMRAGRTFDHAVHVRQGVSCESCHEVSSEQHGKLKLSRADCNQCHHKPTLLASNTCESCHETQSAIYQGKHPLANGEQSVMASAVTCQECHSEGGRISRHVAPTCVACHDDSYADTLKQWMTSGREFEQAVGKIIKDLPEGHSQYKTYRTMAEAYRLDGSASVHNPNLFKVWRERITATP